MAIGRLTVLGKSDATITMILDNLESNNLFPSIRIINNMDLPVVKPFAHPLFTIELVTTLSITDTDTLILGVLQADTKRRIIDEFDPVSSQFMNLIHRTASISTTTLLGVGCLINSLVSVAAHSTLGNFVSINRNASVGHHTTLHDFITINPGAHVAGNVTVGACTQIGMGAVIVDGLTIGENTVVGAGSVVTRDLPANVVAYGNPARIVRQRN